MNVTELARRLKMPTKDLLQVLPQIGFDIGARAIKIDDRTAERIVREWPERMRELRRRIEAQEEAKEKVMIAEKAKPVKIPPVIIVKEFAARLELPVTKILTELMKNGILSAQNEKIDYETAAIVAEDFGFQVSPEDARGEDQRSLSADALKEAFQKESEFLEPRPPVVVIMGHVDHGKTMLLDAIRKTNVVAGEAGGITQHIGAYQVEKKNRKITFIDTPGHEAFSAMRSRGARAADVAILVVAADDGVKPQTKEAIHIIKAAELPMLVAINKMDKEAANIDRVKSELAEMGLTPEDWGGKTVCVPISAKKNENIDELLDMVLLVADMEKDRIRANPRGEVLGTVVESHVDRGAGPVATVLVQNGILKTGHHLSVGGSLYGKVKSMRDWNGQSVTEAGPSMPVQILGFKEAPFVGDVVAGKTSAEGMEKKVRGTAPRGAANLAPARRAKKTEQALNLIVKADVLGSLEAILSSLEKISHPEITLRVVGAGLGQVTETDVLSAEAAGAQILGFHVKSGSGVSELADEKKVAVKYYSVIYKLLDDVTASLEELLGAEVVEKSIGKMRVLKIFRTEKNSQIIGGKVEEGKVAKTAKLRILRKGLSLGEAEIVELQEGKQVVNEVMTGQQCGLQVKGKIAIEENDVLEVFTREEKERKIVAG